MESWAEFAADGFTVSPVTLVLLLVRIAWSCHAIVPWEQMCGFIFKGTWAILEMFGALQMGEFPTAGSTPGAHAQIRALHHAAAESCV